MKERAGEKSPSTSGMTGFTEPAFTTQGRMKCAPAGAIILCNAGKIRSAAFTEAKALMLARSDAFNANRQEAV